MRSKANDKIVFQTFHFQVCSPRGLSIWTRGSTSVEACVHVLRERTEDVRIQALTHRIVSSHSKMRQWPWRNGSPGRRCLWWTCESPPEATPRHPSSSGLWDVEIQWYGSPWPLCCPKAQSGWMDPVWSQEGDGPTRLKWHKDHLKIGLHVEYAKC